MSEHTFASITVFIHETAATQSAAELSELLVDEVGRADRSWERIGQLAGALVALADSVMQGVGSPAARGR